MRKTLSRLAMLCASAIAATVALVGPASAEGPVEYVSQNGFTALLPYGATQCVTLPPSRPDAPDQRFEFQFNSFPNAFYASYNFGARTTEFWRPDMWVYPPLNEGFQAQACATNTIRNLQDPQGRIWVSVVIIYYATPA